MAVKYPEGATVFLEHMNDLFALGVPGALVRDIILHAREYYKTNFVFQTKDPYRALEWRRTFRRNWMIGTTIESDRPMATTTAPSPEDRACGMQAWEAEAPHVQRFVTIEPILDFDVDRLLGLLRIARPDFVNIGADSKGSGLVEPSPGKVRDLLNGMAEAGLTIRKKNNLGRLLE